MTFEKFKESASSGANEPPPGLGGAAMALWHDARGDWEQAHACAQGDPSAEGSWVHAYLHRKEGELGNAAYWYSRARRPMPKAGLAQEWEAIARELLKA